MKQRLSAIDILVVLALIGLPSAGCRPKADSVTEPRLVLLYATCTLNKHYLSPYRPEVAFTPNLERFAAEAVVWRRHMSEAGQSGTAFGSIFTGLQAEHHGVFRHPTRLSEDVETIGEAFKRAGWSVATWLDHGMASQELGYARGADEAYSRKLTARDDDFHALLKRLARRRQERALVVTNFTVTHGPYQGAPVEVFCRRHPGECAPRDDRETFDRLAEFYRRAHAFLSYDFPATRERAGMTEAHVEALAETVEVHYRANVAYLDQLFGDVVEKIRRAGLWDESVVVFTADHGETLFREGTHFKWTHGHQLAPEVLEVPLLVRAPGLAAGSWEPVTRSIDVLPTLAGLAGVRLEPAEGRGVDLSGALSGDKDAPALAAWSHTALVAEPVLEASQRWSLFHSLYPRIDPELTWVQVREQDRVWQLRRRAGGEPRPAVFDLAADPRQLTNLFDVADTDQRRRFFELSRYHARLAAAFRDHADRGGLDRQRQEELLKSLGYID